MSRAGKYSCSNPPSVISHDTTDLKRLYCSDFYYMNISIMLHRNSEMEKVCLFIYAFALCNFNISRAKLRSERAHVCELCNNKYEHLLRKISVAGRMALIQLRFGVRIFFNRCCGNFMKILGSDSYTALSLSNF